LKTKLTTSGTTLLAAITAITLLAAAPAQAQTGPGDALSFNGTNQYVSATIGPSIHLADSSYRQFNGLLAYWRLDEGSGTTASNSAGQGTGADNAFGTVTFTNFGAGLPGTYWGSVAWGDYNNDGLLDILLSGDTGSNYITSICRNNGDGTFTDINAGLPGLAACSVAWGDYNNDGLLDILLSGDTGSNYITCIFQNNGDGTFTDINAGLPGLANCSVAWGDYNNDGLLDILLSGDTGSGYITRVYQNNGDGTFTDINAGLPGLAYCSVAWGDYNNDGLLDILLSGYTGSNYITSIYRNNGDGTFIDISAGLPGVAACSVAWGDYNNDGLLDILLSGDTGSGYITRVYQNNGDGTFTNIAAGLPGVAYCSAAWGDYNNDGLLDILLSGDTGSNYITSIYQNNGDGTFTDIAAGLPGLPYCSVAWGDFDNDGRLDLVLSGLSSDFQSALTSIYKGMSPLTNTPPAAPTGLAAAALGNTVWLSWTAPAGGQTPAAGLSYNLRVGTTPGGSDILSPESNITNGFRRLPAFGWARTNALLKLAPGTTNYWSVQAVDSAFAGSPFATEGKFVMMNHPLAATLPPASIGSAQVTLQGQVNPNGQFAISWFEWGLTTDYDNFTPQTNVGTGSNAVAVSALLTGLSPVTTYHFRLVAYSSLGLAQGADQRFTTTDAPRSFTSAAFVTADLFEVQFLGAHGLSYTVLASTNLALPLGQWSSLGTATETGAGHFQFVDTNSPAVARYYRLRWP
jgi:hypothetical protein